MPLSPESKICYGIVRYWRMRYPTYADALVRINNGGKRNASQRHHDYMMGEVAGTSDYLVALPSGGHPMLWMEVKTPVGKPSDAQIEFLKSKRSQGHCAVIVYGIDEAKDVLDGWMHGELGDVIWLQHFDGRVARKKERNRRMEL